MLRRYAFKNFCSFKDKTEFSLSETNNIFRTGVIVGENAGGKTNFVKSLSYLKSLFKENNFVRTELKYINDNYKKGSETRICDTMQEFYIAVVVDDVEYKYSLKLDYLGIKSEGFSMYDIKQDKNIKIFELDREEKNITLTDPIKMVELDNRAEDSPLINLRYNLKKNIKFLNEKIDEIFRETTEEENNGLYIVKFSMFGIKSAVIFSRWINENLFVNISSEGENYFQSKKIRYEDIKILEDKTNFLPILKMSDKSIKTFELDLKAPFSNTVIVRETEEGIISKHELIEDSAGIRDYFPLAIQIYKVKYQNKVAIVDEMDSSLNPVLSDKIIAFINGSEHKGQFIFTTHNVLHLDLNIYRKKQINIVTKNLSTLNSEMYSLAEFEEISEEEEEPIYKYYLRGMLGGTPSE